MKRHLLPLDDRGPLRTMFALTSMPIGGAEILLLNMVRHFDRDRILPEICCLKQKGELGEALADEVPVHSQLLANKYDLRIVWRLARLFYKRRIDALVTVGAGDKMFWGRFASQLARLPVVVCALHSTGWPDGIGRLNRLWTPWTDAFVATARQHRQYLIEQEKLPAEKVHWIPNGVDTDRFRRSVHPRRVRAACGISEAAPVVGIVAALRQEKNLALFLEMARRVTMSVPDTQFIVAGDGPERPKLEWLSRENGLGHCTHFLGIRQDIPSVLSALDVFVLTSHMEANPVSILEAMSMGIPVVAPQVGSIGETVQDGRTGFLVPPGDAGQLAGRVCELILDPIRARAFGERGRQVVVANWSLDAMVRGYEDLITGIYRVKTGEASPARDMEGKCLALSPTGATSPE
ncbi:MAG: glycosyltransferase [Pirellulales bacterium]|nr:glycosyltransferase [Pirellulales bacterium]